MMFACAVAAECPGQTSEAYQIVKSRSELRWTGYYLFNFGEHTGTIDILDGKLFFDSHKNITGFIIADMRSIRDTDMPYDDGGKDLGEHLMGKDFFDATQYPHAKLEIIGAEPVEGGDAGNPNTKIVANLTIKQVTAPITLYAIVNRTANQLTITGKFKFDRTRWGIEYNSGKLFSDVGDGAISDAIALEFNITSAFK
jgi:polyisoprenoid-binding protein YceI